MYEENCVRVDAGYTLPEWFDLGPEEKALEVAHWRIRRAVEAHNIDWNERHPRKPRK